MTFPGYIDIFLIVLYTVFAVCVLVSNLVVIIVIIKSPDLHHPTLWNIAFMAAWDLAYGLYFLVFIIPCKIMNAFVYPEEYGKVLSKLFMFIYIQNMINVVIALVDRYISLCWPLRYHKIMSPKIFTIAVSSGVLVNVLRLGLLQIPKTDGVYNKALGFFIPSTMAIRMFVSIGFIVGTVGITSLLLIRIRLALGKSRLSLGSTQNRGPQLTYTLYLSTIVYILCYIPIEVSVLLTLITKERNNVLFQVGMASILSNSFWNVFIYASKYEPFRRAFMKVFCPTYFRERARREAQVRFQKCRMKVYTVDFH